MNSIRKLIDATLIALLTISVVGCDHRPVLDRTNPDSVAENIVYILKSADTVRLRQLVGKGPLFLSTLITSELRGYGEKCLQFEHFKIFQDLELHLVDLRKISENRYLMLLKTPKSYYSLSFYHENMMDETDIRMNFFSNANELCNEYDRIPYMPFPINQMEFKKIQFRPKKLNHSVFDEAQIELRNGTLHDYSYLKFQVVLKKTNGEIFFTRTIESNEKIFKNDITLLAIAPLRGFQAPFNLMTENWTFEAEILEAGPKPKLQICEMLESAENQNKTKD